MAVNITCPVVVFHGDRSLLMKMGTMATIGASAPGNLVHVLLDNGVHDSTGEQSTVSPMIDWCTVALPLEAELGSRLTEFNLHLAGDGISIYPGKLTKRASIRIGCIGDIGIKDIDRLM